jgi:hypothetical protein
MADLKLIADSGGGTVSLKAPAATTSNAAVTLKLPVADGSANQLLKTDGSGQLGWATDSSGVSSDAQYNTVGGTNAGDSFNGTNALRNTLFGYDAGTDITNADDATAFGSNALGSLTTGARNTAFGVDAGAHLSYSDNNVCLGYKAGATGGTGNLTGGVNCIIIGYEARATAASTSNEVTIGNDQITKFRVPGINFVVKDTTATEDYVLTVDANGEAGWEVAGGTVADGCIYENSQTISNNYTIASGKGAHSVGPITNNAVVTLNGVWVIS